MKDYELSILFHPDLEMNLDPAVDKVKKLIETVGGKITKEEPDGKKHTAYTVDGQDFAVYYYFEVQLPPDAPKKINSTLNIADETLRILLVKADPRRAKYEAHLAEENAKAEENAEAAKTEDEEA